MSIRVTTSVDLNDVEVEVEIDDEMLAEALEKHDHPLKFVPDVGSSIEAVYHYFASLPVAERPECVRQMVWYTIGRIL